jgi:hypothetical protein
MCSGLNVHVQPLPPYKKSGGGILILGRKLGVERVLRVKISVIVCFELFYPLINVRRGYFLCRTLYFMVFSLFTPLNSPDLLRTIVQMSNKNLGVLSEYSASAFFIRWYWLDRTLWTNLFKINFYIFI